MNIRLLSLSVPAAMLLVSCGDPDSPGIEYMPDMYRSPAVEAYVDYGQDPFYVGDSLAIAERNTPSARLPVPGTIPFAADQSKAMYNFPYPYANTPDDYERAGLELHSPIPMTKENVDKGQVIYEKFCMHCHGAKGMGDGNVVTKGNYPAPPALWKYTDAAGVKRDLPEGKMFHSLVYGKNIGMGSHASQLSKEERWTVIQYVKYLQLDGKMPGATVTDSTATAATPPVVAATPATH